MISAHNLCKHYGPIKAVDDITFEVKQGEILGFLGPNGAGKTTTLKIITCFMLPTSGNVTIGDLNIYEDSLEIRKKIGYLPENAPLYPDMEVREYLDFVIKVRRIPPERRKAELTRVVEICGLAEILRRPIGQLSKGFRQRAGLAQAMIHEPEILILDEPTSGLDPNQIVEIRNLIKKLGKEKTVILSTHTLSEVQATCQRVVIIDKGKIVADSPTEQLKKSYGEKEQIYLELRADNDDIEKKIKELQGVTGVKAAGGSPGSTWAGNVEAKEGDDVRAALFQLAVKEGWTLLEMRRDVISLEDVFRQLTAN
jgi:ABC-2 type transport system ATP-binding protein